MPGRGWPRSQAWLSALMPIRVVSAVGPASPVKGQSGVAPPGWNKPRLFLQFLTGMPARALHRACLRGIVAEQPLIAWSLESPLAVSARGGMTAFTSLPSSTLEDWLYLPSQTPRRSRAFSARPFPGAAFPWGVMVTSFSWVRIHEL